MRASQPSLKIIGFYILFTHEYSSYVLHDVFASKMSVTHFNAIFKALTISLLTQKRQSIRAVL